MVDREAAQQIVQAYVDDRASQQDHGLECGVVFVEEEETEWIFWWNSKLYLETGNHNHMIIGTRKIAVSKTTGEFRFIPMATIL